jgi:uncharacterized protein YndB with AHSA1/START domain
MALDQIERELTIDAPVERVWAALTQPESIKEWFGDRAEIDLQPGGAAVFQFEGYGSFHATLERVEPYSVFSYRWARQAEEPPHDGNSTLVEFTLIPEGTGTRLRVVETGFATLDLPEAEQVKHAEENRQGWQSELDELRQYVQRVAA